MSKSILDDMTSLLNFEHFWSYEIIFKVYSVKKETLTSSHSHKINIRIPDMMNDDADESDESQCLFFYSTYLGT